jgi:imidazolonepropionase-like amidohydrolase
MIVLANIATLYDGTGATSDALHREVDLLLDSGRVVAVVPHDLDRHGPARPPRDDLSVIDCTGKTVTPGLVDCHGHITFLGLREEHIDQMNAATSLLMVERVLYTTLVDGGVTTVRDVGGATLMMKNLVEEGVMIGPRLKIAITMLSSTGGHGDFRGPDRCHAQLNRLWPAAPGRPSNIVDGPWECRQRVREIAACGADLIKVCASPGVASPSDRLEHREFSPEEMRAICDEASHRGMQVAAHAHSKNGIEMAIESGVRDIQHISFMDERLVELAHARGCNVTPTAWVLREISRAEGLLPVVMEKVKRVVEHHHRATAYARSGGLKILAGSDAVLPGMHGCNFFEIRALMDEGLSALEAWFAATGQAAREIGALDTGTLVKGQRADLLVCDGDVLSHPERLAPELGGALVEVVKEGVAYRGALDQLPQRTFHATIADSLPKGPGPIYSR